MTLINSRRAPSIDQVAPSGGASAASRRQFVKTLGAAVAAGTWLREAAAAIAAAAPQPVAPSAASASPVEQLLRQAVLKREAIDQFLDPTARVWAKFHPCYGYLLRNAFLRDGVDGARTLSRYDAAGRRHQANFPDQPCRINTYGDSFTQGHQVSDGETWQEVLAAHFCEPIRNYGIGGFGVYQAYRRLQEIEADDRGAPFVVLNIWGDDHLRSIAAWRWLSFPPEVQETMGGEMFHANPWDHARLDAKTGALVELKNPCSTPESLYDLCDADFVLDAFGEDEVVHAMAAIRTGIVVNERPLERMATAAEFTELDLSDPATVRSSTTRLYHCYAVRVGMKIVERLQGQLQAQNKKLMILLSYPQGSVWRHCMRQTTESSEFIDWHPQEFRDFLAARQIPFVDTVTCHVAEFDRLGMDAKDYVDRYYIGHYNPTGNHFFAHAVKPSLVDWLDPKPPAYRQSDDPPIAFEGYLPS
ncbi:MAG: hypothetical protein CMJ58_07870 [Planctomycetaceae bacterium]|nr:hypothetical protein [Planctomycetaceae bacterium]